MTHGTRGDGRSGLEDRRSERREALARMAAWGAGDGSAARSEEEARALLEARARALARAPDDDGATEVLELLLVELAGETYGVETRYVFETFPRDEFALLPGVEPPVVGITAWRGELLTLLDLRGMVGLAGSAEAEAAHVVVIGEAHPVFGVLVDDVRGIRGVPASAARPVAEAPSDGRRFLRGITPDAVLVVEAAGLIRAFS